LRDGGDEDILKDEAAYTDYNLLSGSGEAKRFVEGVRG